MRGKHLVFLNMRHFIDTKKDVFIKVHYKHSFQEFKDDFYVKVIEYNFTQQAYAINGRSSTDLVKNLDDLKEHKRYVRNYLGGLHERTLGDMNPVILFASRTLAKLLNISHSVANSIINDLEKKKLISTSMFIEEISWKEYNYLKLFTSKFVFRKDYRFFLHQGRKLKLNHLP